MKKSKILLIILIIVIPLAVILVVQLYTNPSLRAMLFQQDNTLATYRNISAKALTDHECNTSEWHFVITQVNSQSNAPTSIFVTWENGATQNISLAKYTGQTAHYDTTQNLNSTVKSATTQIYNSWGGQFNLSHGPCGSTASPSPTPSASPSGSGTPKPSATSSSHPSPTPTRSPSSSATASPTASPTGTPPVGGPSNTPTPTPGASTTASPTGTPGTSPTATPTVVPTSSSSATSSPASVAAQTDNRAVANANDTLPQAGVSYLNEMIAFGGASLLIGGIFYWSKKKYY